MTVAKKTLGLPRAKDLKSNKLEDIQDHLGILYDVLDRSYRFTSQDIRSAFTSTIDHGLLNGLGDDDHTQYIKDSEFTQNSGFLVGTGAGTFQEETGNTARASLSLGTGDSPTFSGLFIENADPEIRLTDTGDSEYTRITRADTSALAARYNRVEEPGALGKGLDFNGSTGYVQFTQSSGLPIYSTSNAYSVVFWFKSQNITQTDKAIYAEGSSVNNNTIFRIETGRGGDGEKISVFVRDNSSTTRLDKKSTTALTQDVWFHIAWVDNLGTATLYINGSADATSFNYTQAGTFTLPNTVIGGLLLTALFTPIDGVVDEVAAWSKALSANDVSDLYNSGTGLYIDPTSTFPTDGGSINTNLEGLWHLDEGATDSTADSSNNSNTGALNPGSGEPAWVDGKITIPGLDTEVRIWSSQDGTNALEEGIQTFGDGQGRSILDGQTIRFNIEGVEKAIIDNNGNFGLNENAPETLSEWTSTEPYFTLHNSTEEDSDGGRESRLNFKGEQSGGEETTLARIEISHDGSADDEKGKIILYVNDGDDGDSPTQALEIGSDLLATFAGDMLVAAGSLSITSDSINGTNDVINLKTSGSTEIVVTTGQTTFDGNVGIGTVSPTLPLDVKAKAGITATGGYAIKLTNNTTVNSVKGQLVEADDTDENSYKKADADSDGVIGIVYNAGIADGSEVWIVIAGIAEVLLDAGGCVHHDRLISSNTAGSADVWNVGGAVATHFREIGHALETVVGAGLAKASIHLL